MLFHRQDESNEVHVVPEPHVEQAPPVQLPFWQYEDKLFQIQDECRPRHVDECMHVEQVLPAQLMFTHDPMLLYHAHSVELWLVHDTDPLHDAHMLSVHDWSG